MNEYTVWVTRTQTGPFIVEAENPEQAEDIVWEMIDDGDMAVELDSPFWEVTAVQ